jgi:DNA ligase-1
VEYKVLSKAYAELEAMSSTLSKREILSRVFLATPKDLIKRVAYLVIGEIFPPWMQKDLNLADKIAISAISRATGATKDEIISLLKKEGDLGSVASVLMNARKQSVLFTKSVDVAKVYDSLERIASSEGQGSVDKKTALLAELISNSSPEEAKYLVRTALGQLRIGVGEGIVRDAIAIAFSVDSGLIERAFSVLNDFGEIAEMACQGEKKLRELKLKMGRPLKAMLYPKAETIGDGIKGVGLPLQAEFKYDGFRTQIHKNGDEVKIFTRRLDDVTKQFADVVNAVKKGVKVNQAIFDSETVGVDPKTGKFVQFQKIGQRIKRKYDLEKTAGEIPVVTYFFDLLFLEGNSLLETPLKERFELLKGSFKPGWELRLADFVRAKSKEEVEEFYGRSLESGVEGIMIKNVESPYKPGQRVGYGYKIKPEADTLDLVIVGAEWGEGKRANWFSSFIVAASKGSELAEVGRMATGTSEQDLEELTARLKKIILSEEGKVVRVKPQIIVEVGFQEIQSSPKYSSGFALRFPRLMRLRDDKALDEIDSVEKIKKMLRTA